MGKKFVFAFSLFRAYQELRTLEEHLKLIEEQISRSRRNAQCELEVNTRGLSHNDWSEYNLLRREYEYHVNCFLPRALRGPFLVTLFSVYESAVREVADLTRGQKIPPGDIRGDFLEWAKKYYKEHIPFELSGDNERWMRLRILYDLRNAIAHANGRLEMIVEKKGEKILKQEGVKKEFDFIVVSRTFLRETFTMVKEELKDLLVRHREWDKANRHARRLGRRGR